MSESKYSSFHAPSQKLMFCLLSRLQSPLVFVVAIFSVLLGPLFSTPLAYAQPQPDLEGLSWKSTSSEVITFEAQLVGRPMFPSDFSVSDVNGDGLLDITVAAHSVPVQVFSNAGRIRFRSSTTIPGVDFQEDPSDVTPEANSPAMNADGLYLFMEGAYLRVVGRGLSTQERSLRLMVLPGPGNRRKNGPPLHVLSASGDLQFEKAEDPRDLKLTFGGDFSLTLAPDKDWFQFEAIAMLPKDLSFDQIRLGSEARSVASHLVRFTTTMTADWHGLAWADLNDDARLDLFVVQGGMLGEAPKDDRALRDLLWLSHNDHLHSEVALAVGITKSGAPGRGVDLVDVDRNGLLDLYVRNARSTEPRKAFPNALHLQVAPMRFEERAQELGIALGAHGKSAWLDMDADGWMDLVWGNASGLTLYRNLEGQFAPEPICPGLKNIYALSTGDVDLDGRIDIVAAGWPKMMLVLRQEGGATCIEAESIGLPKFAVFAQLVDIDGDGRLDLFSDPHGVSLQAPDGEFVRTGLLTNLDRRWKQYAWADFNGDGRIDLASLERPDPRSLRPSTDIWGNEVEIRQLDPASLWVYENLSRPVRPWLQIDLVGPKGNSPAKGARVLVRSNGSRQEAIVGQFEGSQSSDGHHRLYFGFSGDNSTADIEVHWPDGTVSLRNLVPLRERHVLRHPAAAVARKDR